MIPHPIKQLYLAHRRSLFSFLAVGTFAALLQLGSFTLFWKGLHLDYQISVSIAYVLSVIFHFTANRFITFRDHGSHFLHHIFKYLIMIAINYLITMGVMHMVVERLHLSPYLGIIAAIGATVGIGYCLSRYWVFKRRGIL